jgi:hypothetical protein
MAALASASELYLPIMCFSPHEKRPGDREVVDSAFLVGVADEPEVGRGQGRGHSLYEYTA